MISPRYKKSVKQNNDYEENIIQVIHIPNTVIRKTKYQAPPKEPDILKIVMDIDDPPGLDDVEVGLNDNATKNVVKKLNKKKIVDSGALPFTPHLILEVLPNIYENNSGAVIFKVLIGLDGVPKEHNIVEVQKLDDEQIKQIVHALYSCRWQTLVIEGIKMEYWIRKEYQF